MCSREKLRSTTTMTSTLAVVSVLVVWSFLGQQAAATACQDCASSYSSVSFATPTGPCSGACSPEPQCLQNCKSTALAKCTTACNGSCWFGKCDCDRVCSDACAGAGSECNSSCINSQSCQSCKDTYTQQCTTYCNANCI